MGLGEAVLGTCWHDSGSGPLPSPHRHNCISSNSSWDVEGTLHFPVAIACTTPHTKEVTMPCRQPCIPADNQIQTCRKATAEKILCQHGSEWAHHYWIKYIYFCQYLYDSWIAYFFYCRKKVLSKWRLSLSLDSSPASRIFPFEKPSCISWDQETEFLLVWGRLQRRQKKKRRKMQANAWFSTG